MQHLEVILFVGVAAAASTNAFSYPTGEKHAVLLFLRQEEEALPDWAKAVAELTKRGWSDVDLSKASPVSVERLPSVHPDASASYKDALNDGFAALIFSEAVNE